MSRRASRGDSNRSLPATVTVPLVGGRNPVIMRIVVVLPAPLGPSMPTISPSSDGEGDAVDGGEIAVAAGQALRFDHSYPSWGAWGSSSWLVRTIANRVPGPEGLESSCYQGFAGRPGPGACHSGAPALCYPFIMAEKDKASGMKSAYELALERLEKQGIERPREEALSTEAREKVAEIRRQAEAKMAELEILYHDRRRSVLDPTKRQEDEDDYVRERRRIEEDRDRKIEQLRTPG